MMNIYTKHACVFSAIVKIKYSVTVVVPENSYRFSLHQGIIFPFVQSYLVSSFVLSLHKNSSTLRGHRILQPVGPRISGCRENVMNPLRRIVFKENMNFIIKTVGYSAVCPDANYIQLEGPDINLKSL